MNININIISLKHTMDDDSKFLHSLTDHLNNHTGDWQTPLINNLFSQVQDLRSELKEKNNQINKLLHFQELLLTRLENVPIHSTEKCSATTTNTPSSSISSS